MTYGAVQLLGLGWPIPTLPFGTPSAWLRGRSGTGQTLVWGATLGPGFLTRNPYACMWLAMIALSGSSTTVAALITGAVAGVTHGTARAVGILLNIRRRLTPYEVMSQRLTWKFVDGIALFAAAGLIVPTLIGG